MLAELAFTPSVFDESVHEDKEAWRNQLRELGSSMYPRTSPSAVTVTDLYSGSWTVAVTAIVKSIKDSASRFLCEGLLKKFKDTTVRRPACRDWPGDDSLEWAREAITSDAQEKIDRIVVCQPTHRQLIDEHPQIRSIDEVFEITSGFWNDIASPWPQPMNVAAQVRALRLICLHAEFLALISPYVRGGGGNDDETPFARGLIRSAFQRPTDYPNPLIEIHSEAPDHPESADYSRRLANRRHNIEVDIRSSLAPGQQVRVFLWPKLLDRYVIAGLRTQTSDGKWVRSPRWGVSTQHIARPSDDRPTTTWSALPASQLNDQFKHFCSESVTGFVDRFDVTG